MRVLICDEDIGYAARCKRRMGELAAKEHVNIEIETVDSGEKLLFFKDTKYAKTDLFYLAWEQSKGSGFEIAKRLRSDGEKADIIFCAKDDRHAIDGYDVEAFHYLLKSWLDNGKFDDVFLKAMRRIKRRHAELLSVSCAGEHLKIPIEDILYFEVQKRIITVYYYDENETVRFFEFYSSLSKIEEYLFGSGFVRIHSSYLVAARHVKRSTATEVEMMTGASLPVGKAYRGRMDDLKS